MEISDCEKEYCDNLNQLANDTGGPRTIFSNCSGQMTPVMEQKFDSVNITSFWNFLDEKYLRHSWGWTVAFIVAYTLIFILGIIGNLMVILVVIKRRQMRNVTNLFIMNLAVADLFVILFCVPATLLSNIFTPWILGSVMCKSVTYVQGVSVCASAYSLAAISMERCRAIYRALVRPRGFSKKQALYVICLIWIIAFLLTIPWALTFDVVFFKQDGMSYCVETWENEAHGKIYFIVANLFCCYCLPLILISMSNAIIWCHVKKREIPQDSATAASIKKIHKKTRQGVRRMLGIVNLAFLLSWLPLYVLVTTIKFTNINSDHLDVLLPFAQLLGSFNSSINPVLYAFLNRNFLEMFKSLLPRCLICGNKKQRNITVLYSTGQQTITNKYRAAGSGAISSCSRRSISHISRLKFGTGSEHKDGLHNNTRNRVKKSYPLKPVLGRTPETIIIIVTSPTSSSASVVIDKEKISFYLASSTSNSKTSLSLEHV